ncbi:MAG: IPT/TIG domain-containing protein [Kofleriaceae bacterium]
MRWNSRSMTILLTGALTVGAASAALAQSAGDDGHGRPDRQARKRVPPPPAPTPAPAPTHDDDDHGKAGDDHGKASDDHGKAGDDHGKAGDDHGKASDDHGKAGDDHGKAGDDHGKAGDDHGKAGDDRLRADPPMLPEDHPPREWKLDHPVVSGFWPPQGKPGTKVVIRGRNFAADTVVEFAGAAVADAKITPGMITFAIAAEAATGPIVLRRGQDRPLLVGTLAVAAAAAPPVDVAAEVAKRDAEHQRAAEAAWADRQAQLAKDRAARAAVVQQRWAERDTNRAARRAARADEIRARWQAAFLADPATLDELALHAQRTAELDRMRDLAEVALNKQLAVRVEVLERREADRHTQRMTALEAAAKAGGTP